MINFENQRVLVISPHQDDAEFGCGGIIQRFLSEGSSVAVVHGTLIDVEGSYQKYNTETGEYEEYTGEDRMKETERALAALGEIKVFPPLMLSKQHHRLDTVGVGTLSAAIEKVVLQYKPTVILYTAKSSNQDHEAVHRAMQSVLRPYFFDGVAMEYEIFNESDFVPNFYLGITLEELDNKLKAFHEYRTQDSGDIHAVSCDGIYVKACYRGKQSYQKYAEAFKLVRVIA